MIVITNPFGLIAMQSINARDCRMVFSEKTQYSFRNIVYSPQKKKKKSFFPKENKELFLKKISHKILDLGTFLKKKFPNSEALKFLEKKNFSPKTKKNTFS